MWGDGREFSLDRLSLGKGRDRSLRKMVLEACERGELVLRLVLLWMVRTDTAVGRIRTYHIFPFTLHLTHRSIRITILLHSNINQGEL